MLPGQVVACLCGSRLTLLLLLRALLLLSLFQKNLSLSLCLASLFQKQLLLGYNQRWGYHFERNNYLVGSGHGICSRLFFWLRTRPGRRRVLPGSALRFRCDPVTSRASFFDKYWTQVLVKITSWYLEIRLAQLPWKSKSAKTPSFGFLKRFPPSFSVSGVFSHSNM